MRSCLTKQGSTTTTISRSELRGQRQRPFHRGAQGDRDRSDEAGTTSRRPIRRGRWWPVLRAAERTATWQRRPRLGTRGRRDRWPAMGPRALERPAQRLPVHPDRGHGRRQAAGHVQRGLPGRLRPRPRDDRDRRAQRRSPRRMGGSGRWSSSPTDPTVVQSLSILIEGDDNQVKTVGEIHQPDNLETTVNGLYITEDPAAASSSRSRNRARMPPERRPLASGSTSCRRVAQCRRQGGSVGRSGPDRRGPTPPRRGVGRMGVHWDRRRFVHLRPRQVPRERTGPYALGRKTGRSRTGRTSAKAVSSSW